MHHSAHPGRDALEVGLALLLVFSFLWAALSRIFLSEKADEGRRWIRAMQSAVPLPVDPRKLRTPVVLPPERRTRSDDSEGYDSDDIDPDEENDDADDDRAGATGPQAKRTGPPRR